VAGKYEPLRDALTARSGQVTWSFAELDRLVGGLPPSARRERTWWANTWRQPQAQSWLSAGFSVAAVDLNAAAVTFAPGAPPRPSSPSRQARSATGGMILDGAQQLEELLRRAGYGSVVAAVAERAVFLRPTRSARRAVMPCSPPSETCSTAAPPTG
jgi:hypothetical protein